MTRVLIVDDEIAARRELVSILGEGDYEVIEARSVAEAERALVVREIDVVVTGARMPDGDGLAVLSAARRADPAIPVVFSEIATATARIAADATMTGAFDFVARPFRPEQVLRVVSRGAERSRVLRENESLREQVRRLRPGAPLVGSSEAIEGLRRHILRAAPTEASVLILGETGSGKEAVARTLHAASARSEKLFLPVNCAGVSEPLLESELFGHGRGSFSGADRSRRGALEAAHGGTLFLDEVGEMSPALQARLLRALVAGKVVRTGSDGPRHTDVRLVVANRRDLKTHVRNGTFREDLYRRLANVPIRVPPLRARKEDLPSLAETLLRQLSRELKLAETPALTPEALERLAAYDFPGNLRELRNVLEHAAILCGNGRIDASDLALARLPDAGADGGHPFEDWIASLPQTVDLRAIESEVERALVRRALALSSGVAAQAARRLGLSRSDLAYKLRRLGIRRGEH